MLESEAYFREMTQTLPIVVWTNLPDGHVDFVNDRWLEYTGQTLDYVQSNPEAWMMASTRRTVNAPAAFSWKVRAWAWASTWKRASDGAYRWHLNRSVPLRDAGNIIKFLGTCTDIDDVKRVEEALNKSQERLNFTLEATEIGAWDLYLREHTAWRSLRHDQIFGYSSRLPEWTYEKFLEHVHPEDRAGVDAKFQRAVAEGEDWDFECRIIRVDGSLRWIWARGSHYRDPQGNPTRMLGMVMDITDRKQAAEEIRRLLAESQDHERELRGKQEQLIQAAKLASIGVLASGMAHELNNLLNNIGLFIGNALDHLQRKRARSEKLVHDLRLAMQQVKKAATIISHLRVFARTAGSMLEPVSIHAILRSALSLMQEPLRLDGIEITVDLSSHEPVVAGNAIQLEQVFINLLTNARDAMEHETRKAIALRSAIRGEWVKITVRDTGAGIPAELQPWIFEPFSTKDVGRGTGLGLSISYGIIEEHGGRISVESRPGEGSTFIVELPIIPAS